jgi:hypothetical protein
MIVFLFWIAFSIAVGTFAGVRSNRNAAGWFFLLFIISPLFAGIFRAILEPVPQRAGVGTVGN